MVMCANLQKKEKEAAEAAARELNDLFAVAIKQPKAPPGVRLAICSLVFSVIMSVVHQLGRFGHLEMHMCHTMGGSRVTRTCEHTVMSVA